MKAVILAGGKGTRLAPYTAIFPKPLVPIGQQAILEIIIRQLNYYGFNDVVLTIGHLGELIKTYLYHTNGRLNGVNLSYVTESNPTGTAASLANVADLDEPFLVMNGDVLTTIDYRKFADYHLQQGGLITIAMQKRQVKIDLGVIHAEPSGIITDYVEKPEHTYCISMGIYMYDPIVLNYIEPGKYLDFPTLVKRLLANGEKVVGYSSTDYWKDIGRGDDYANAQDEFEQRKEQLLPDIHKETTPQ